MLTKREHDGSGSFQPKRRKEYEDDGQSSEFGMMMFENSDDEKEFAKGWMKARADALTAVGLDPIIMDW